MTGNACKTCIAESKGTCRLSDGDLVKHELMQRTNPLMHVGLHVRNCRLLAGGSHYTHVDCRLAVSEL